MMLFEQNSFLHYESVFDKELATLKNVEVTLKVQSDAILKFCTTRPISYALKDRVEKNLNVLLLKEYQQLICFTGWV